jgi:phosphatidylglycerophosphatase A
MTHLRDYINIPPVPAAIWQKPSYFIAFGFGSGAMPFAPGTFGTLMAIPFYLAMQSLPSLLYLGLTLIIIISSIWLTQKVTQEIGVHDHQGMCLDEIVGYLVTMYHAPKGWPWILVGFLLFRLFDIWKPWPIRTIDARLSGGMGIILDDVLAGVYSCIIIQLIALVI